MKHYYAIAVCLFLAGLFVSCDVAREITLKNKTNKPAVFRMKSHNQDYPKPMLYYKGGFYRDTVNNGFAEFRVEKKVDIHFGWGTWMRNDLRNFVSGYEYIEIVSENDSIRITDKDQIYKFFRKGRYGLLQNYMRIKIR